MLPKPLASRVRAAFRRISEARRQLVHNRHRLAEQIARLQDYESNPEAFAARNYHGLSVDSYPVQTTIRRTREDIEGRFEAIKECRSDVLRYEAEAERIVQEAIEAVGAMRPTSGRVPFPDAPTSEHEIEAEYAFRANENKIDSLRRMKEVELEIQNDEREFQERSRISDAQYVEELRRARASMTPEEIERSDSQIASVRAALQSGKLTVWDILKLMESR
jgi:hypothetical protein